MTNKKASRAGGFLFPPLVRQRTLFVSYVDTLRPCGSRGRCRECHLASTGELRRRR